MRVTRLEDKASEEKGNLAVSTPRAGTRVQVVRSDASNLADIDKLDTLVKGKFDQVNVVFINVGISELAPLLPSPCSFGRQALQENTENNLRKEQYE